MLKENVLVQRSKQWSNVFFLCRREEQVMWQNAVMCVSATRLTQFKSKHSDLKLFSCSLGNARLESCRDTFTRREELVRTWKSTITNVLFWPRFNWFLSNVSQIDSLWGYLVFLYVKQSLLRNDLWNRKQCGIKNNFTPHFFFKMNLSRNS